MNDKPNSDNSQLREQMWDLVYGLLEQDESRDLITRIKSDPQAARLYAEVRLQADLVGYAAQVEDSSLVLTGDSAGREVAPAASQRKHAQPAAALGKSRSGNILAGIVAVALTLLIGVGLFLPHAAEHQLAQSDFLMIDVSSPRDLPGGITNEIPVRIARPDGVGQMAQGEATVFSADGAKTYSAMFLTNGVGHGKFTVPGEAMQPGATLTVAATAVDASRNLAENELKELDLKQLDDQIDEVRLKEKSASSLTAALPVREEPQLQYFFAESPVSEPGQENQLAMWGVNAYSNTPAPVKVAEVAVEDEAGASVAMPTWRTEGNLALIRFALPEAAENREPTLGIRDAEGDKVQAPLSGIVMQPYRQSAKSLEQKDAARYGLATNAAPEVRAPKVPTTEAAAPLPAAIMPAAPPAPATPAKPGEPSGEQRRLASSGYARANELPAQQSANSLDRSVAANGAEKELLSEVTKLEREAWEAKQAENKGMAFTIPTEYDGRRLAVRLNYRGLDVAEKQIDSEKEVADKDVADGRAQKKSGQVVTFDLPPEISGPVVMQLFDLDSYELLQRQVTLRESPRKLNVGILGGKDTYAPGEVVSVTLQFTDENGQPAPGTQVGVRLWNEQVVQSLGKRPLLLADALQTTTEYLAYGEVQELERARSLGVALSANRAKKEADSTTDEKLATSSRLESLKADAAKAQSAAASRPEAAGAEATPAPPESTPDASEPAGEAAKAVDGLAVGGKGFGGGAGTARFYADDMAESYKYELETRFGESETPQLLATNSALVRAEYEAAKRQLDDERQARQAAIGRILLIGGIGAAVFLGLLMLLKLPAKARVVVPSLALAAASVALGWNWIGMRPGAGLQQIAMVEDQSAIDSAPQAAKPMARPARSGNEFDRVAMNAEMHDPAALGGIESASGAAPASDDYGSVASGLEETNLPAPAIVPADTPTEGAPTPRYAKESFSGAVPGSGGFAPPSGGAAKGPAGRGGVDADRDSPFARETLERQKMAELAESKQIEQRKAGTDLQLAQGKNLPEAIGSRGGAGEGSFDQPLSKSMRAARPAPSSAPAQSPAPGLPPESKPAAVGAPAASSASTAPISPESDETSAAGDKAGMKSKLAGGGKPEGKLEKGAADFNEQNLDLLDRFGSDMKRRSMSADRLPELRGDGAVASGAPASIYFNPRLIADDNGRATIEFTMPPVESEYRLLIDALGSGRIGALQQVIECREAAK